MDNNDDNVEWVVGAVVVEVVVVVLLVVGEQGGVVSKVPVPDLRMSLQRSIRPGIKLG